MSEEGVTPVAPTPRRGTVPNLLAGDSPLTAAASNGEAGVSSPEVRLDMQALA